MSASRAGGYLRAAETSARAGRHDEAQAALRLAAEACAALPPQAPEHTDLALTTGEVAQWAGDRAGAAAAFAQAAALDREAHRCDALATVRRMRAALAAWTAGDRAAGLALAEQAVTLAALLGDDLQAEAHAVRARIADGTVPPPAPTPAPAPGGVPPRTRPPITLEEEPAGGPPAAPGRDGVEELLHELDELIGLDDVKDEIRALVALAQVAQARANAGMPVGERTRHLAMVGAPGTGKTTVARLLGRLYGVLGVIGQGHIVEVTRADLVAGFVGQTAQRTNEVVDRALGGVLFVDEAYSLVSGSEEDFGREALAELVKRMEDDRGRLVVILAGYPAEMETMISANSGLRSRLQETLVFPDYDPPQLARIFDGIAAQAGWRLTDEARRKAHEALASLHAHRGADWANARTVRSFFEACLSRQALRATADGTVGPTELDLIDAADVADDAAV